jgi:hypothetical protein
VKSLIALGIGITLVGIAGWSHLQTPSCALPPSAAAAVGTAPSSSLLERTLLENDPSSAQPRNAVGFRIPAADPDFAERGPQLAALTQRREVPTFSAEQTSRPSDLSPEPVEKAPDAAIDSAAVGHPSSLLASFPSFLELPGTTFTYAGLGQPTVSNVSATNGATSAALKADIDAGTATTTVKFEYGLTAAYGSIATYSYSVSSGFYETAVVYPINLTPATVYHFRCVATNWQGITQSPDFTFTTLPAPVISTSAATDIGDLSALLNGTANAAGGRLSLAFQIGRTTSYGTTLTTTPSSATGTTSLAA